MKAVAINISVLISVILGCSSFFGHAEERSSDKILEPLYGVVMTESAVEFRVKSTGCTNEDDFVVHLNDSELGAELVVSRTKPDKCRRMPKIVTIKKTLDYSGLEPNLSIMLLNPLKVSRK